MEEIEIKKCPYCGHDPEAFYSGDLYVIKCDWLGCNNPKPWIAMGITIEDTIKAWNEIVSKTERKMNVDKKNSDERN